MFTSTSPSLHRYRIRKFVFAVLFAMTILSGTKSFASSAADTPTVPIGVNLDFSTDWSRALFFVDAMKSARPFGSLDDNYRKVRVDTDGWPEQDARTIVFDLGGDDPKNAGTGRAPDMRGIYHLSFEGQAKVAWNTNPVAISYDKSTNISQGDINFDSLVNLFSLSFTETRRLPTDLQPGSGIRRVMLIRPHYEAGTPQLFTTEFMAALAPFSVIRVMDTLSTNRYNSLDKEPFHTDTATRWEDHRPPSYATMSDWSTDPHLGMSPEVIVDMAIQANKDLWYTIPISATDDYIVQLARMMNNKVTQANSGIRFYIEYSNEVWNFQFPQNGFNWQAAIREVARGNSVLNVPVVSSPDDFMLAARRYGRRSLEISNLFKSVFGASAINDRIRVIPCWQMGWGFEILDWINLHYGAPKQYFYGYAIAPYFRPSDESSVRSIINGMLTEIDTLKREQIAKVVEVATYFGLMPMTYEGGPHMTGDQPGNNITNEWNATNSPEMTDVMRRYLQTWYSAGGNLYVHYNLVSGWQWGLTQNITALDTPKFGAIRAVLAEPKPALTAGITAPIDLGSIELNKDEERTFMLRVDGKVSGDYIITLPVGTQVSQIALSVDGKTLQPTRQRNADAAVFFHMTLAPGLHTFRLKALDGFLNLHSLRISTE